MRFLRGKAAGRTEHIRSEITFNNYVGRACDTHGTCDEGARVARALTNLRRSIRHRGLF
jgi:hypothetical protein